MTDVNETEDTLPADALERLVNRVVAKFTQAEISTEEAASRLVGTGRFEENSEALEFLRGEICPKLEERLHEVEEDVQRLQVEADRIRGILTQSVRGPSLVLAVGSPTAAQTLSSASAAVASASARSRKEKADKEKSERKRKGASGENTETVWGSHEEASAMLESASASSDASLATSVSIVNHTDDMREATTQAGHDESQGDDFSPDHASAESVPENDWVGAHSRHTSDSISGSPSADASV